MSDTRQAQRQFRRPAESGRPAEEDRISAVCVVVPARNEQARIGRCLDSIGRAVAELRRSAFPPPAVRVAVVADRCTDRTVDIVASFHPDVELVLADLGNVGAARALGARTLLAPTAEASAGVWLANTDADSTVPRHWLSHMVDAAQRGADLLLGTVEPDEAASARLRQAWTVRHRATDGHPHVHAANLGIRDRTYAQLGGWSASPTGEDEALVRAAEALGAVRIARTGAIPVTTSSRLAGRAPHGFAHYLQHLADDLAREQISSAT